jgi:hypothetical protein
MTLKTKIGMIFGFPIYLSMMAIILILASSIWIIAKLINLIGILDSLDWLFKETIKRIRKPKKKNES